MRLFQNSGLSGGYRTRLQKLARHATSFSEQRRVFLTDRYGASHFLKPVLDGDPKAFFTNGDDPRLQQTWALENGLKQSTPLDEILLAQIEAHRTDVFYNNDPVRYPSSFIKRLPACVKHKLAWRAAPSGKSDFGAYDAIVCNFPAIISGYQALGWRSRYFAPAHDPEMDAYAANTDRPIDVLFVGTYSRHHKNRVAILDAIARLRGNIQIRYHLDRSRMTALAETPLGWIGPLAELRRPKDIRSISVAPVFGRDLYSALSKAKIVLNGAIDMAGRDRGNMRCWEALGCGALLLSDEGNYPPHMQPGLNFLTYDGVESAVQLVNRALGEAEVHAGIAVAGHDMIRRHYSKAHQWSEFEKLL